MEGWVDLGERLHTEMVYTPTEGLPSKYYLAVLGRETNSKPVDHKSDAITTIQATISE